MAARAAPARARQPARRGSRRPARRRDRGRVGGPLHAPLRRPTSTRSPRRVRRVATLLPGVEFSTRSPYPDARRLLDAGVTVALATDCNPGSCYSSSMALCVALAVREMRLSPAEALWSATAGGASALRRDDVGHLGGRCAGRSRRPRRAVVRAPRLPPGGPARPAGVAVGTTGRLSSHRAATRVVTGRARHRRSHDVRAAAGTSSVSGPARRRRGRRPKSRWSCSMSRSCCRANAATNVGI